MINEYLKKGDYIFNANGELGRIIKINKQSYTYAHITGYGGTGNVGFNGLKKTYYDYYEEWFHCEDVQAKALESAYKKLRKYENLSQEIEKLETLIGKAKFFLKQVEDIPTIDVTELEDE